MGSFDLLKLDNEGTIEVAQYDSFGNGIHNLDSVFTHSYASSSQNSSLLLLSPTIGVMPNNVQELDYSYNVQHLAELPESQLKAIAENVEALKAREQKKLEKSEEFL